MVAVTGARADELNLAGDSGAGERWPSMSPRQCEAGNPNLASCHVQTVAVMMGQTGKMQVVISLLDFS